MRSLIFLLALMVHGTTAIGQYIGMIGHTEKELKDYLKSDETEFKKGWNNTGVLYFQFENEGAEIICFFDEQERYIIKSLWFAKTGMDWVGMLVHLDENGYIKINEELYQLYFDDSTISMNLVKREENTISFFEFSIEYK